MMPCVADDVAQKRGEDRQWHAGDGHWNAAKATKNAKNNAWGAHLRMMDLNAGSCAQKMQKKPPAGLKMAFLPALMLVPPKVKGYVTSLVSYARIVDAALLSIL